MGGQRYNRQDPKLTQLVQLLNQTFKAGNVNKFFFIDFD